MPTLARPDVDVLDGLTTAIIVDQERMGANPRSTVGTATDANAMLRILFSRLGKPHIGSPQAFSFNVASVSGERRDHRRARRQDEDREGDASAVTGGMCPRCEGRGAVTDFDLTALYDDEQVAQRGRAHDPRLQHGGLVRPHLPRLRLLRPGQADQEVHQARAARPALQGADQDQGRGHQPHLRGADPADPEVVPVQGRRRDAAAHPRVRRAGGRRSRPAPTATAPGSARRRGRRRSTGINIADACAMQISDLAEWVRGLDEPSVAPLLDGAAAHARLVRRDRARLPLARPAVGHAVGRRGAAHEDDPPPRLVAHRRHLRLRRADDRPAPARHPADERPAAAAARQGQHGARRRAQAGGDRDRRPRRRPRPGRRQRPAARSCFEGTVEGLRASDTLTGRHLDDRASLKASVRDAVRARWRSAAPTHAQPAGRRRRHPARRARRRHRRRRARARAR